MAKQTINLGTIANDDTGDDLRSGGDKINDNFDELYVLAALLVDDVSTVSLTAGTGKTLTLATLDNNKDIILSPHGTGVVSFSKASITGGTINATTIGASTPSSGVFTSLSTTSGDIGVNNGKFSVNTNQAYLDYRLRLGSSGIISWSETALAANATADVTLLRGAAGTLALRGGANPQTFLVYNTYSNASNYERGFFKFSSDYLTIGTEALGTGIQRDILLMSAGMVKINGTTSSFPALKQNGAGLQVKLADDSAGASLLSYIQFNTQTDTDYTLALTDDGKKVKMNSTSVHDLIVPPNGTIAFLQGTQIIIQQANTGTVTVVEGSGVTVNSRGGLLDLAGQYAEAVLTYEGSDVWVLSGDLA